MSTLNEIFKVFVERVGLPDVVFENNLCAIQFDDLVVNFYDNTEAEALDVFTQLGDVPANAEEKAALYRRLLVANAFGRVTGGGVLGVDDDEKMVLFSRTFDVYSLTPEWLEYAVQAYLVRAEELQKEVLPSQPTVRKQDTLPSGMPGEMPSGMPSGMPGGIPGEMRV